MTKVEKNLAKFLEQGGAKVMGAVVMWALSGVKTPRAELRQAMEDIGLGKAVGKDPRPTRLLGKAVDACRSNAKGLLFRRLGRERWAIVEEVADGEQLGHKHSITLMVTRPDPDKDEWVPEAQMAPEANCDVNYATPDAHGLADRVIAAYEDVRLNASTEDLSKMLTAAMVGTAVTPMLGAVSLRENTGGVYFVPGASVAQVLQLKALVERLGGGSHLTALTLYGDQANLDEAAHAARASFTVKLNELKGELSTFVAEMTEGGKAFTSDHVGTRIKRLDALRERVDMWGGALGDVRAELEGSILEAQESVAEAMGL